MCTRVLTGFVLDFVNKIPGVFKEFSYEDSHPIHRVLVFSVLKKPTLIFFPTSRKLSARTGILIFAFNLSPVVNALNFFNSSLT